MARRDSRGRRFVSALLPRLFGNNIPGHTTKGPPVGFVMATNGIQFMDSWARFIVVPASFRNLRIRARLEDQSVTVKTKPRKEV